MADSKATTDSATEPTSSSPEAGKDLADQRFVGQWNRLISTTNWEKGRIICQWREALITEEAAVTAYSDETWAQLVGGVTSQHVGRLRRVFQRFGDVYDQYEGLYWSHFQAALDWDDAEMWLEGSIQNGWSVSQMRGKRWETLGTPPDEQQAEAARDEQANSEQAEWADAEEASAVTAKSAVIDASPDGEEATSREKPSSPSKSESAESEGEADSEAIASQPKRTALNIEVESLPDDVAEAFEAFKLAIIAHRRDGWHESTPESIIECLDALKQLVHAEE